MLATQHIVQRDSAHLLIVVGGIVCAGKRAQIPMSTQQPRYIRLRAIVQARCGLANIHWIGRIVRPLQSRIEREIGCAGLVKTLRAECSLKVIMEISSMMACPGKRKISQQKILRAKVASLSVGEIQLIMRVVHPEEIGGQHQATSV